MILVTGATGILGRVIVLELCKEGREVRAAKRPSSDLEEVKRSLNYYTENAEPLFNKIEWIDMDLHDKKSIQKALDGVDEVYHCAAQVSYDPSDREKINKVNVEGTKNMLECCKNANVRKFLYVSSAAIFKNRKSSWPIDEDAALINGDDSTVYAASKYKADVAVFNAFHDGLNTVIINPGMIIGSGNWQKSSGEFLKTFIEGFYTFPGGAGCVDVRDVAKIAVQLMHKNIFGKRFLLSSQNKKYRELSDVLTERLHKRKPFVLSERILNIGRILNILTFRSIPKLRLLTRHNIEFLTSFQKICNHKIISTLDYDFLPVKESLQFHMDNFLREKE